MAVTLRKAFIDPWASKPVHESVLHARRMVGGKRLSWPDREELQDNSPEGLSYVLRGSQLGKQYIHDYDDVRGSWGTWDRMTGRFVGHACTQTGARVQARKFNQGEL